MRSFLKLKPGTGTILAFVILAVVFASIVGVVFILLNNSSLKPKAADLTPTIAINAPKELECSGEWKTIKTLGKSRPEAIAGYNGRLVIVDYQPFPADSGTKQYLRAREINPEKSLDTDWYADIVGDSQSSLVLKQEGGSLNLYAYSGTSAGNRIIVKATYKDVKSWSGTSEVGGVYMGITGPDTAFLDGKFYRIKDSLPDASLDPSLSDSNGYLQECIPDPADQACWFWPTPASIEGPNSSVLTDGGLSGTVYLRKDGKYTSVGIAVAQNIGSFKIPASVSPGTYELTVGNNPGVVCKHPNGDSKIDVRASLITVANRCDFNKDTKVDSLDQTLLGENYTTTDPAIVKIYDLNGDNRLTSADQLALAQGIKAFPTPTKYCYSSF